MKAVNILQLNRVAEAVALGQGYELVDLEWKHEAGSFVLRVCIDRREGEAPGQPGGGVSLEDCAKVSRELSCVLDVEDVIPGTTRYTLEVSSPGLNRPLKREADFRRFVGKKAKIRTKRPVG